MRRGRPVPEALKRGPVSVAEAVAAGLTPSQLRSTSWRRVAPGMYVWSGNGPRAESRLAAWRRRLPRGAVFSGLTAAQVYGLDLDGEDVIEVTVPLGGSFPVGRGLHVRRSSLAASDVVWVRRLPVTSPSRTWFDLARHQALADAVAAVDWALHRRRLTLPWLRANLEERRRMRGVPQARRVFDLSDPRAESLMESRLRMLLVESGLPAPEVQYPIGDGAGRVVRRLDLCYPRARLGIEYDGDSHRTNLVDDDRRQNWLLARGFVLLRFTASDLYRQPQLVVNQVRAHLDRRSVGQQ